MLIGQVTCRCCHGGALTLKLMLAINALEEIMPRGYDLHITSGYRCRKNNKKSGGVSDSEHLFGRAIDLYCPQLHILDLLYIALQISSFKGIGLYIDCKIPRLHLDVRSTTKQARWCKKNGVFVPFEEEAKQVLF